PLGIDADVTFRAETMPLGAGDLLLLYSDGAIEQESPADIAFGRDGLVEAVRGANTPANVIDRVLDALRRHTDDAPPDDDMTLLALAWMARGWAGFGYRECRISGVRQQRDVGDAEEHATQAAEQGEAVCAQRGVLAQDQDRVEVRIARLAQAREAFQRRDVVARVQQGRAVALGRGERIGERGFGA